MLIAGRSGGGEILKRSRQQPQCHRHLGRDQASYEGGPGSVDRALNNLKAPLHGVQSSGPLVPLYFVQYPVRNSQDDRFHCEGHPLGKSHLSQTKPSDLVLILRDIQQVSHVELSFFSPKESDEWCHRHLCGHQVAILASCVRHLDRGTLFCLFSCLKSV